MNIRQLEYFVSIVETGQITKAAQRLYIAQPPLSRSMKRLEKELGATLFIRTRKGLELTNIGKILYKKSKALLKYYNEILSVLQEVESDVHGDIRIGSGYPTIPLLSSKIAAFQNQFPFVEFHIIQEDPDELVDLLEKGHVDMIFLPHIVNDDSFEAIKLTPDPMVLAVNPSLDPTPEEEEIPIEKLDGVPMCMLRNGDFYGYNQILMMECQKHGFTPRIICQCNSAATAMILVTQGLGLSYQPKMIVDTLINENLYWKKIKGFESTMMPVIMFHRDVYLNKASRLFLSKFQLATSVLGDGSDEVTNDIATEINPNWKG